MDGTWECDVGVVECRGAVGHTDHVRVLCGEWPGCVWLVFNVCGHAACLTVHVDAVGDREAVWVAVLYGEVAGVAHGGPACDEEEEEEDVGA